MPKLIGICGVPGTGKTTLMREWMSTRIWTEDKPAQLLDSHVSNDGIRVFGRYENGEIYAGTDKLSMSVMPTAIEYLRSEKDGEGVFVFEGDRLSSIKFFSAAREYGYDVYIIILETSEEERERRYGDRMSDQNQKFIQGRITKVKNINTMFGPSLYEDGIAKSFKHHTKDDMKIVIDHIESLV